MRDKLTAAITTVVFLALIRTDAAWKLWQVGMVGIMLYEALNMVIQTARGMNRENRRREYRQIRKQDARRWAEEWFNPYREVS